MTEVIENTDIDLTVLFDFESEIQCMIKDCDATAEWKCHRCCCGTADLMCNKHKERMLIILKASPPLTCGFCKAVVDNPHYTIVEKL